MSTPKNVENIPVPPVETDPRIPVLVKSFKDLQAVRDEGRKDKKPGVIAHSTRTMDRIVKGIQSIDPSYDVADLLKVLNDGRGQTSKNKVLNDLLSDLGV